MRTIRWATLAMCAASLILLVVNGANLRALINERIELGVQLQTMRDQAARPPHECGTVIMPGETCQQTLTIVIPGEKEPTF